jgi:hypothetical protein
MPTTVEGIRDGCELRASQEGCQDPLLGWSLACFDRKEGG